MSSDVDISDVIVLAALILALYFVRDALRRSGLGIGRNTAGTPLAGGSRLRLLFLEFIELLLAGVFFVVGGAKLVGRQDMVALFRDVGIGQWFRYLTGGIEVTGAALLIVPLFAGMSAIALGGVMIAATLIELFVLHRPPVAALACLTGHSFVAWARMSPPVKPAKSNAGLPVTWSNSVRTRWAFGQRHRHVRQEGGRAGRSALGAATPMALFIGTRGHQSCQSQHGARRAEERSR